jgi:hypothetical protein
MIPKSELPYIEWADDAGAVQRIYADTVENEQLSLAATVTTFPVENGGAKTDNIYPEQRLVTLKMFFSATPIRGDLAPTKGELAEVEVQIPPAPKRSLFTPGGLTAAAESIFSSEPAFPKTLTALRFGEPFNVQRYVTEIFDTLVANSTLVTIRGRLATLENMAIKTADIVETAENGDGVSVDLAAAQIQFVSSDVAVAIPIPSEVRAQKPKDSGAKGTEEHTGKGASVGKAAANSAGITAAGSGE